MPVNTRLMLPDEARIFLEVHHSAVRGLASRDYSPEIVEAWAPLTITNEAVAAVRANPDGELRVLAEIDNAIVGLGAIVPENSELRACYVVPEASRSGVRSAIVATLETMARQEGVDFLHLDSSVTAAPFYAALGYAVISSGEHILGSGDRMACIKMRKAL